MRSSIRRSGPVTNVCFTQNRSANTTGKTKYGKGKKQRGKKRNRKLDRAIGGLREPEPESREGHASPGQSSQCHVARQWAAVPRLPIVQPGEEIDGRKSDDVLEEYMEQISKELEGVAPGKMISDGGCLPIGSASLHVARSVGKREIREQPKAEAACKAEWKRLQDQKAWDIDTVREWADVKKSKKVVHIGSLHELCTEKGSELPADDPGRKYKGRVVFLGDRVRDQHGRIAVFEEMTSSPATMEASKMIDFLGVSCTK